MGKLAGAALLSALLVGAVVVHHGVLTVDVDAADGSGVWVPVPVVLARGGLFFAPDEARRIEAPRAAKYLPYAGRVLEALRGAADGVLVEVIDGDRLVTVTREGDLLRVRVVEGDRSDVEVIVPLESGEDVVRAYDAEGRYFETSALVGALSAAPRGELVRVDDGESRVRIRRLF